MVVLSSKLSVVFSSRLFQSRWARYKKSAASTVLGAFLIFFITACNASELNCPPFAKTQAVTITKVIDGDTVRLADSRTVRLIGINTPEPGHSGEPSQPWAKAARRELQKFLNGHALLLTDRSSKDKYGRTLAHLYNLKGQSAEAHLLQAGLGWHVAIPPNLTQAQCLAKAEQQARRQRIALWGPTGTPSIPASKVSGGGFQRITGQVTKISFGKRGWWINMGKQIAVVIYPEHQHRFDRKQLAALKGKTVTVRGWVYPSRSKKHQPWRVKLETPYALR